jgi:hypothetical protein
MEAAIADMNMPQTLFMLFHTEAFCNTTAYQLNNKWHKVNKIVNKEEENQNKHETIMEWMERDRSRLVSSCLSPELFHWLSNLLGFKDVFHSCDLDPESIAAYTESMNLIKALNSIK